MTSDLRSYQSYKDSGIKWLGDVPEHWYFNRSKFYFREVDERSETGAEELLSVSHITGVTPRNQKNINMFKAESYIGYKLCKPGQIAINTMWAWMGPIGVSQYHGIISSSYHTYEQINRDNYNFKFLDILLRSIPYKTFYKINSTGITTSRLRLYPKDFLNIRFLCPPKDEQAAIVRFLDYIDKRIRKSINSKKKLIKLLEEEKQAIINQAVTRGLDPNVRMKPSGVEWLGDVPEHWEIRRLKTVMNVIMGQSPPSQDCSDDPIGIPFLQGCADFGKKYPNPTQFCLFPNKKSPENAILLSVRAPVGKMNFSNQIYGIGRGLCALKVNSKKMEIQYAYYLLEACKEGLTLVSTGSTYDAVSIGDIGDQPFLLPPFFEQTEIIKFLKKETSDIDKAMDKEISEIALLTEYHTRLISDVVTGKLDVRDAAARLPEEIEEPDDIEEIELEGDTGDYDLIEGEVDPNLEQNEN